MKILIIGSEGFIGKHALNYFSEDHDVFGADIFDITKKEQYFQLNISNTDFEQIFETHKFDICINASGNGSVPISITRPVFDFELNVSNTVKLLDAIRMHNPSCKFINMSSAAVYGNPSILPIKENVELKPLSPYGWHKLYAENVCKEYFYLYNIQTINLRLFSVYGKFLKKQLFWDIYQKCIRTDQVELFGTGEETRDFIYIDDLLNALNCVINRGLFNGESVNIASGEEVTIAEAAQIFVKNINPDIKLSFNKISKPGDPKNWRADIDLIKSFGFDKKINMEEGLSNVATWLKESI